MADGGPVVLVRWAVLVVSLVACGLVALGLVSLPTNTIPSAPFHRALGLAFGGGALSVAAVVAAVALGVRRSASLGDLARLVVVIVLCAGAIGGVAATMVESFGLPTGN